MGRALSILVGAAAVAVILAVGYYFASEYYAGVRAREEAEPRRAVQAAVVEARCKALLAQVQDAGPDVLRYVRPEVAEAVKACEAVEQGRLSEEKVREFLDRGP